MSGVYSKLNWQESAGGVTIDCSLDIAVHPAESPIIFVTIPGVDGSVDGYEDKYVRIAENIQQAHGVAVVRMANPFITSYHWQSNVREVLQYILDDTRSINGHDNAELRIMAHSAGASIIAQLAWEYPEISQLLLINPAAKLHFRDGLEKFEGKVTILVGSLDPSLEDSKSLRAIADIHVIDGVDHYFSGEHLDTFITAPNKYLF